MDPLRVIIVDDESLARRGLRLRLESIEHIEILAECGNGLEAINKIAELEPDLIFLDIQMPKMNGFDVVSNLQQDNLPLIIFVTAFDAYAVEAFDIHAVDYLLKPIEPERLEAAIERARSQLMSKRAETEKESLLEIIIGLTGKSETSVTQLLKDHSGVKSYPDKIAIKDAGETTLVLTKEIDWVDAAGDYMCIHANDITHVMRITMKQLEDKLDPTIFQRVHRSTIVNLDRVSKVCSHMNGEFYLQLINGSSVKMSRSYKDKVKHFL
ncbi:MAG: LytTR family DNA-binding domain-containing protein [Pseudomonadales bacterium]|nr:LytTR family DNA-binding domain-containing protein [Pseudomonadales bacterium]MDG1443693.1 LytTR family DNA-binding domain-containing protein [Pseudomonadales bacterium]